MAFLNNNNEPIVVARTTSDRRRVHTLFLDPDEEQALIEFLQSSPDSSDKAREILNRHFCY